MSLYRSSVNGSIGNSSDVVNFGGKIASSSDKKILNETQELPTMMKKTSTGDK